jgi:hypothetical protein
MPRIPVRLFPGTQVGATNPASSGGRSVAVTSQLTPGTSQGREHFAARALNALQTKIAQAVQSSKAAAWSQGNMITGVAFTGGSTVAVAHKLGRAYVGAHVMNPSGGYLSYKIVANSDPRLNAYQISIVCQNTCTADVLVY